MNTAGKNDNSGVYAVACNNAYTGMLAIALAALFATGVLLLLDVSVRPTAWLPNLLIPMRLTGRTPCDSLAAAA